MWAHSYSVDFLNVIDPQTLGMEISGFVFLAISLIFGFVEAASVSRHVQLGNHEYFLPPQAAWSFSGWRQGLLNSSDELVPLTVVHLNNSTPDPEHIQTTLKKYQETDDVWTPEFTEGELAYTRRLYCLCSLTT